MADEVETYSHDETICPWCGYAHSDAWEYFVDSDKDQETTCDSCGKSFVISRYESVSYTTRRCEDQDGQGTEDA